MKSKISSDSGETWRRVILVPVNADLHKLADRSSLDSSFRYIKKFDIIKKLALSQLMTVKFDFAPFLSGSGVYNSWHQRKVFNRLTC